MKYQQRGFVLLISFVFILILAMLVIYLLRTATLQERIAANAMNRQRAFQATEAVLREAEAVIRKSTDNSPFDPFQLSGFSATCNAGLCRTSNIMTYADPMDDIDWSNTAITRTSTLALDGVSEPPKYVIEIIQPPMWTAAEGCSPAIYRILGKGWGKDNSTVLLESYVQSRPQQC